MSEESKNVLSYIKHSKVGDQKKGFIGSQNTHIWALIQPFFRCKS